MRYVGLILAALAIGGTARGDAATDAAAARMKAREAERAAAATQPARITQAELEKLQRDVLVMKSQLAEARAEADELRAKLAKAESDAVVAKRQAIAATQTAAGAPQTAEIKNGMTLAEAKALFGKPEKTMKRGDGTTTVQWQVLGKGAYYWNGGGSTVIAGAPKGQRLRRITAVIGADEKVEDFTDVWE